MMDAIVELTELIPSIQVVELAAKTRSAAIRALVWAAWEGEKEIAPEKILKAIEEREATAQTIVADGFALPHAIVDWEGDFRLVLGRSRAGVEYGVAGNGRVHLMVLLVVGQRREHTYVELLAAVARFLSAEEFRREILEAPDVQAIERLLRTRVGLEPEERLRRRPRIPLLSEVLVRQAMQLVESLSAQALLLAVERPENVPWELLSAWTGRLLIVTAERSDDFHVDRQDTHLFDVRHAGLSRMDRANLGLLLAASTGLLNEVAGVVCVTGADGGGLDCITVARPEARLRAMFGGQAARRATTIRPPVILRALSLAIELAVEGREGRPVGAMFVIGDSRQVMRHARQLVLNPFHGYSRQLRNLLDPSLTETIKEFALIDGAFVVEADGTVLSAGSYLLPRNLPADLPPGLGARHQTAAAITATSQAMAVTVSQSTGTVTVFRNGAIVFTLERASLTRW